MQCPGRGSNSHRLIQSPVHKSLGQRASIHMGKDMKWLQNEGLLLLGGVEQSCINETFYFGCQRHGRRFLLNGEYPLFFVSNASQKSQMLTALVPFELVITSDIFPHFNYPLEIFFSLKAKYNLMDCGSSLICAADLAL